MHAEARMEPGGSAHKEILVSTRLLAADPMDAPVTSPDPAVLSSQMSQRLGIVITAQIENEAGTGSFSWLTLLGQVCCA